MMEPSFLMKIKSASKEDSSWLFEGECKVRRLIGAKFLSDKCSFSFIGLWQASIFFGVFICIFSGAGACWPLCLPRQQKDFSFSFSSSREVCFGKFRVSGVIPVHTEHMGQCSQSSCTFLYQ